MKPLFKIAWAILAVNIGTAVGSAPTDRTTVKPQALRVRLADPFRKPLAAAEIKSAISGKTLLVDDMTALGPGVIVDVRVLGGCAPTERFYADGKWERGVCARTYLVTEGHWSITTDRFTSSLCTTVKGEEADCRTVWQRASPDELILTAPNQHRDGGPAAYYPYRTLPL